MAEGLLVIDRLVAGYGASRILHGVSLEVGRGEVVAVIGPNGAGKSTLLRASVGMADIFDGAVRLDGVDLAGRDSARCLRAGLAIVLQGRCNFPAMTVGENLRMGGFTAPPREVGPRMAEVMARIPLLGQLARQPAGTLSGGQQQLLEIGMILMTRPRALLLDEPTLGLDPANARVVLRTVSDLAADGMAVLVVEQNARQALAVAHRGYVLADGRNRHTGRADAILDDPEVQALYLGSPHQPVSPP